MDAFGFGVYAPFVPVLAKTFSLQAHDIATVLAAWFPLLAVLGLSQADRSFKDLDADAKQPSTGNPALRFSLNPFFISLHFPSIELHHFLSFPFMSSLHVSLLYFLALSLLFPIYVHLFPVLYSFSFISCPRTFFSFLHFPSTHFALFPRISHCSPLGPFHCSFHVYHLPSLSHFASFSSPLISLPFIPFEPFQFPLRFP